MRPSPTCRAAKRSLGRGHTQKSARRARTSPDGRLPGPAAERCPAGASPFREATRFGEVRRLCCKVVCLRACLGRRRGQLHKLHRARVYRTGRVPAVARVFLQSGVINEILIHLRGCNAITLSLLLLALPLSSSYRHRRHHHHMHRRALPKIASYRPIQIGG